MPALPFSLDQGGWMTEVRLSDDDSLERALKLFKRKLQKSGLFGELRRRRHYVKPSEALFTAPFFGLYRLIVTNMSASDHREPVEARGYDLDVELLQDREHNRVAGLHHPGVSG